MRTIAAATLPALVALSAIGCTRDLAAPIARNKPSAASAVLHATIASDTSAPILVGAGDIASCTSSGDSATASLLDTIPGLVFTTGDNVTSSGTLTQFQNCFGPTWGRHAFRMHPAVGDKEYATSGAAGYYAYFGGAPAVGDSARYYYSYDHAGWHIVVLNNQVSTAAGSTEEKWLKNDLAAHSAQCTIAIWEYPRFYSGGTRSGSLPLWNDLYAWGADVVLNGQQGNYERFAPQTPSGVGDASWGIREFIVGTGGGFHGSIGTIAANSEARNNTSYGVLKLVLGNGNYSWQFLPAAGGLFTDAGNGVCHNRPPVIANAGAAYNAEKTVRFDASATVLTSTGQPPISYKWDFGDGAGGSDIVAWHAYASPGKYTAKLIATEGTGMSSAPAYAAVTIANVAPKVNAGPDLTIPIDGTASLNVAVSDAGNDSPFSYSISWGDGSPTSTGSIADSSARISATHHYTVGGKDTIRVAVADAGGLKGSDVVYVTVGSDLVSSISVSPWTLNFDVGSARQYTALLKDASGHVILDNRYSVAWTSSDTSTATVSTSGLVTGKRAGVATIKGTSQGKTGSAKAVVWGLGFGPWHLADSLLRSPYTLILRGPKPTTVIASLDSARKNHFRVILRLVRGREMFQNADRSFSLALWKQEVARYVGIDFSSYVADGTLIGHSLIDEPEDPTNWGGQPVPFAVVDSAAEYSKALWPTMLTVVNSAPSLLAGVSPYRYLDYAFGQYTVRKGDVNAWAANEVSIAQQIGLGLWLSLNVLNGNTNFAAMTADQLRTFGVALARVPYACALTMWKYDVIDPSYFQDPSIIAAAKDVAAVAASRAAHSCKVR